MIDMIDIFSDIAKLVELCPWEFGPTYFYKIVFMSFSICFSNNYHVATIIKDDTSMICE